MRFDEKKFKIRLKSIYRGITVQHIFYVLNCFYLILAAHIYLIMQRLVLIGLVIALAIPKDVTQDDSERISPNEYLRYYNALTKATYSFGGLPFPNTEKTPVHFPITVLFRPKKQSPDRLNTPRVTDHLSLSLIFNGLSHRMDIELALGQNQNKDLWEGEGKADITYYQKIQHKESLTKNISFAFNTTTALIFLGQSRNPENSLQFPLFQETNFGAIKIIRPFLLLIGNLFSFSFAFADFLNSGVTYSLPISKISTAIILGNVLSQIISVGLIEPIVFSRASQIQQTSAFTTVGIITEVLNFGFFCSFIIGFVDNCSVLMFLIYFGLIALLQGTIWPNVLLCFGLLPQTYAIYKHGNKALTDVCKQWSLFTIYVTYNINYFAFLLYMQDYNFRYAQPSAAVLLAMIFIVLTQIVLFSIVFWKFSWQNSTNKIPDEQAVCAQTAQNIVAIGPIAENPSTVSKSSQNPVF